MPQTPNPITLPAFHGLIGVARRDITPPIGIYARNWGAAKHDVAEGIHRPLTLSALTLQERVGSDPLILVAADLCSWREPATELSMRQPILDALKLHPSRLMMNLSHTHSAPTASPAFAELPGGDRIGPYLDKVRHAALAAVKTALADARPAVLEWTAGRSELARNRDWPDPNNARFVCGFNPDAPADDVVLVGRVVAGERIVATLVNYACHPVSLAWDSRLISPDYIGALREVVELQTQAPCLFLQGACGELAPAEEYSGEPTVADANGRRVGYAALSALAGMGPANTELGFTGIIESGAPLATWTRRPRPADRATGTLAAIESATSFKIKTDYPPAVEIQRQIAANTDRIQSERLRRKLAARKNLGDDSHVAQSAWIWRAGDIIFVGIANEAYSLLQTELRRRFAPLAVVVMNLVNGGVAYLPPAQMYDHDVYQVAQSPFERGCLELQIESCAAAIEKLMAT